MPAAPRSTADVTALSGTSIDQGRPVRVGGPGRFRFPELGYRRSASHRGGFRERWSARRRQAAPREGATIPCHRRVDSERFGVPVDEGETSPPSRHAPLSLPWRSRSLKSFVGNENLKKKNVSIVFIFGVLAQKLLPKNKTNFKIES